MPLSIVNLTVSGTSRVVHFSTVTLCLCPLVVTVFVTLRQTTSSIFPACLRAGRPVACVASVPPVGRVGSGL